MKTETKKNLLAASLYIALAVLIVTTVFITVFSIARKAKELTPTADTGTQSEPGSDPTSPATRPTAPTEPSETAEAPTKEPVKDTVTPPTSDNSHQVDEPVEETIPESFSVPANGYISKGFENELPVWSVTMDDYRIHEGIDVLCDGEAEVYACADGTVESVYEDPLMGYSITVYHGGGLRSTYMGLTGEHTEGITPGGKVVEGQVIAKAGDTALIECAEPLHLHFEMTLDGEAVDPMNYIEFDSATMSEYE